MKAPLYSLTHLACEVSWNENNQIGCLKKSWIEPIAIRQPNYCYLATVRPLWILSQTSTKFRFIIDKQPKSWLLSVKLVFWITFVSVSSLKYRMLLYILLWNQDYSRWLVDTNFYKNMLPHVSSRPEKQGVNIVKRPMPFAFTGLIFLAVPACTMFCGGGGNQNQVPMVVKIPPPRKYLSLLGRPFVWRWCE